MKTGARFSIAFLFFVPVLSFALKISALAIYKIDTPVWDDWREYLRGSAGSFAPKDLFLAANDTIYATGKLLDSLFIHLLNGNIVLYQVISATLVLGALLYLQHALLRRALENRLIVAAAFFSTLLMLVPGTYWGRQYIAYHQALPLLCVMAILCLALSPRRAWTGAAVASLTLAAGFAYISGAFACMALAAVLLVHGRFLSAPLRGSVVRTGAVTALAGLIPLAAQLWVVVVVQHGKGAYWVFPYELEFWFFMLGKISRAFSLPRESLLFSLVVTLATLAISAAAALYMFLPIWRGAAAAAGEARAGAGVPVTVQRLSVCLLGLAAAVGVYLALVAAGRTHMRPGLERPLLATFDSGYIRFHFFWVTVVTPWLVAVMLAAVERLKGRRPLRVLVPALALAILVCAAKSDGFDHFGFYAAQAEYQAAGLRCISQQVARGSRSIDCRYAHPGNLMRAYLRLAGSSLSFARYLPPPGNLPFMAGGTSVLFSMDGGEAGKDIKVANATVAGPGAGLTLVEAGRHSRLFVPLAAGAAECGLMQVMVTEKPEKQTELRVFWREPGDTDWRDDRMYRATGGPEGRPTTILLHSKVGFGPSLRLDPTNAPQRIEVQDLKVGCLEPR